MTNIEEDTDAVWQTPFGKALRCGVRDPEEALHIAETHREKAADARRATPADTSDFRDFSRAQGLECRARNHDEIVEVCERHAANLHKLGRGGA